VRGERKGRRHVMTAWAAAKGEGRCHCLRNTEAANLTPVPAGERGKRPAHNLGWRTARSFIDLSGSVNASTVGPRGMTLTLIPSRDFDPHEGGLGQGP
jgi:hypothetical protein